MSDFYTLYGSSISLYTGKVRAYLRYRNIPFIEKAIPASVVKKIGYFMIPVLETPQGDLIQDTTEIIDHLENNIPGPSVYPDDPVQKLCALLLEVYGDEWLVIPAMHYRWKYNRNYILEEFGKITHPEGSAEERRYAGEKISAPFQGALPFLGINESSEQAIEAGYEALLIELNTHLTGREYLFGSRPSIADYGLMGPLYAHNYRDPWSGQLMQKLAPNLVRWVDMMNTPAPESGFFESTESTPPAQLSTLPTSLIPIMTRVFQECIPTMVATGEALADWFDENPGDKKIPRSIGTFNVTIGDTLTNRAIFPFNQWMFQRPLNYYHSLKGDPKKAADSFLHSVNGFDYMQVKPAYQLSRKNYQLLRSQ